MIKLAIIEDHKLFIDGIASLIQNELGWEITKYTNAKNFLSQYEVSTCPDIIMTDIEMGEVSGLDLVRSIRELNKHQKIVVVSMYDKVLIIRSLQELGVNAFISKDNKGEVFLEILSGVLEGKNYLQDHIKVFSELEQQIFQLSKREIEVIKLLSEGFTSKEIAEKMFISELTIQTHRKNILSKLNVKNTNQLIKWAIQEKIVS